MHGGWLYLADAAPDRPKVGDWRVRYDAVEAGDTYSVLGRLKGDHLEPFKEA